MEATGCFILDRLSKGEKFYGYFLSDIGARVNPLAYPWTYAKKNVCGSKLA
jgi:hypothetical protein